MAERYYVNSPLGPGPVALTGAEAHHLASVCRIRPGDEVILFNGDGGEYPARVLGTSRQRVELEAGDRQRADRELPWPVVVACPLPKGDRGAFLVEKLTELGVRSYIPLLTERTVVHPGDGKTEKLRRIVIEASKQCRRNVLMTVEAAQDWPALARRADLPAFRLLADPSGATVSATVAGRATVVVIGPEGGLTPAEVELGRAAGWQPVELGARTLRIETAALALAALLATPPACRAG
jgi:16S rRNA (uracil1498-N3)-methyltransferase